MRGLVLREPGVIERENFQEPGAPGPGAALVAVRHVGVCGTDIHAFKGNQPFFTYPRVLGHELGVEVLEVGAGVTHLVPGQLCCVEPYLNCGTCVACRNGKGNCCTKLSVLGVHTDGGQRERILVPAKKLHPSTKMTTEQLALVEPLGIGAHAVARAQVVPGETVCVIGVGPIGLGVVQFAQAEGGQVIVADVSPNRLEFCRRHMGVTHTIDAREHDVLAALSELTNGDLATAVFDATSSPKSMAESFSLVSSGGRLTFVGLFRGELSFNDPEFHRREMTLLASRNAHSADFTHIIQLIEEGKVDTAHWITHRAKLEGVPELFGIWCEPETNVLKAMIEI